jgi:hypothetical protein
MRLKGVSWGAMTSFAFNTMIGQVTPIAITSIGWVSSYSPVKTYWYDVLLTRSAEILPRFRRLQLLQRGLLLVFPAGDERS